MNPARAEELGAVHVPAWELVAGGHELMHRGGWLRLVKVQRVAGSGQLALQLEGPVVDRVDALSRPMRVRTGPVYLTSPATPWWARRAAA